MLRTVIDKNFTAAYKMVLNQILNTRSKRIMIEIGFLGTLRSYSRGGIIGMDGNRFNLFLGRVASRLLSLCSIFFLNGFTRWDRFSKRL